MKKERITKILSNRGMCSRREAEAFISQGRVFLNGTAVTEQGTKASIDDNIVLDDTAKKEQNEKLTLILNKPLGVVSNLPEKGYKEAISLVTPENQYKGKKLPASELVDLHVVGRLDINSKGLLIFSQDGRVVKKIIGCNSSVEKEYIVRLDREPSFESIEKLRFGIFLNKKLLKRAVVKKKDPKTLIFILKEGKKRQIREMCKLVNLNVTSLKRVRIGNIELKDLPIGKWRPISSSEILL
jgi:23S rRNA pseudouridine2604 synthase